MSSPGSGPKSKRSKAGPSSSKKAKATPSQEEVEEKLEAVGPDPDLMRCPICSQYPRREVHVCTTGHSVCTSCVIKLDRKCPTCRAPFQRTRNYYAEQALDSMKFKCSYGCEAMPMERKNLTSHEAQCELNPNCITFCAMVNEDCDYKLCPVSMEDPEEITVFLDHMRLCHEFDVRDVHLGVPVINRWFTNRHPALWTGLSSANLPLLLEPIFRLKSAQGRWQLYVIVLHFVEIKGQPTVLIKCVRLTDENKERITVSFSLTEPQSQGPKVPETKWTAQPEGIRQLKGFTIREEDLSSYCMIPIVSIQNYVIEGGIRIQCVWNQSDQ